MQPTAAAQLEQQIVPLELLHREPIPTVDGGPRVEELHEVRMAERSPHPPFGFHAPSGLPSAH